MKFKKTESHELIGTKNRLVVARGGGGGWAEMDDGSLHEYWCGQPIPPPGVLPDPAIEPGYIFIYFLS